MPRATISIEGPEAPVIHQALSPEAGRDVPKARGALGGTARRVTITVEAEDSGALRAAVNSYLRWSDVAAQVHREVKA